MQALGLMNPEYLLKLINNAESWEYSCEIYYFFGKSFYHTHIPWNPSIDLSYIIHSLQI